MPATIQLSNDTKRLLKQLKAQTGQTYDALIRDLIREHDQIPKSLFGKHPDLPAWKKRLN